MKQAKKKSKARSEEFSVDVDVDVNVNVDVDVDVDTAEVEEEGNDKTLEENTSADLEKIQSAFMKRATQENKRFEEATDSEYWVALCFQTREQKDKFLKNAGWLAFGDKYIDGRKIAKLLKVPIPETNVKYNTSSKADRKLSELT